MAVLLSPHSHQAPLSVLVLLASLVLLLYEKSRRAQRAAVRARTFSCRWLAVTSCARRYWRIRRALLQEELAERASVAPVSIRRGENGQPLRLTTVRALAVALNVEPDQLMVQPPEV